MYMVLSNLRICHYKFLHNHVNYVESYEYQLVMFVKLKPATLSFLLPQVTDLAT